MSFCGRKTYTDANGKCHNISGMKVNEIRDLVQGNNTVNNENGDHQCIWESGRGCPSGWKLKNEKSTKGYREIFCYNSRIVNDSNTKGNFGTTIAT